MNKIKREQEINYNKILKKKRVQAILKKEDGHTKCDFQAPVQTVALFMNAISIL